jgi:hypothetical protein
MATNVSQSTSGFADVFLSEDQLQSFLIDGVLVVDNILTQEELKLAQNGLKMSLMLHGVDTDDLQTTGLNLRNLSSTNGSGGVLDLYYEDWRLNVAMNEKLFQCTTELWQASFCHKGEAFDDLPEEEQFRWHPFGTFDCNKGFVYMDRVGFRIPTELALQLGQRLENIESTKIKRRKKFPIQRCLTPHLDCCPETFLSSDKTKWRPIQCMVSLTDNEEENTGGFETAKGFHREFGHWAKNRPPSQVVRKTINGKKETLLVPAACVGEYTHIRPGEDAEILRRIRHIPIKAGSAVFWDNRLPHANAYRHNGSEPRCVVYCSFLPDIAINRRFVSQQLYNWRRGIPPIDTKWMEMGEEATHTSIEDLEEWIISLTTRQRCLLGIEDWPK